MVSGPSVRAATSVGLLLLAPVWAGCYGTVSKKPGVQRDLTALKFSDPAGRRIEVSSTRRGTTLDVAASGTRLCRTRVVGVSERYVDKSWKKDWGTTALVAGTCLGVGVPLTAAGMESSEGGIVALGTGMLIVGLLSLFLDPGSNEREYDSAPEPFYQLEGGPLACDGASPVPIGELPIVASLTFPGADSPIDYRATTGLDGKVQLDLSSAITAANFCGEASLKVEATQGDRLAGDTLVASVGRIDGEPGKVSPGVLDALGRRDPALGAAAFACCRQRATEATRGECEVACAPSGTAQACLASRRACLPEPGGRTPLAGELAACRVQYADCLGRIGSSLEAMDQCIAACAAPKVAKVCR